MVKPKTEVQTQPSTKVDSKSKDIKKKASPLKATPKKNGVHQEEVKKEQVELKDQWDYFQLDG